MITLPQVQHIAKLARLSLKADEAEKFAKQLSVIFGYIEILNTANTDKIEPTSQVTGLQNVMRKDEVKICNVREELLGATQLPLERDQIKVKPVIVS